MIITLHPTKANLSKKYETYQKVVSIKILSIPTHHRPDEANKAQNTTMYEISP